MELQRAYGLSIDLPDGKLPGFYAQWIKALAARAPVFDRDKEMLIFLTAEQRAAAYPVMEQYKVTYEEADLLLLPDSLKTQSVFSDYGWFTRSGHAYVYANAVFIYRLDPDGPQGQLEQALLQLEEQLWASFHLDAPPVTAYLTDIESCEWVERVAKAYHCKVTPIPF